MRKLAALVAVFVAMLFAQTVHSANPADLTSFQRLWVWDNPTNPAVMIAVPDADRATWIYFNFPRSKTSNIEFFASSNDKTDERSVELFYTKRVSQRLDVTFDVNVDERPHDVTNTLTFDLPLKNGGLGFVLPLQAEDDVKFGGRLISGNFTLFAHCSLESDRNPRWGISHKGFLTIETAFRENIDKWYLRFSKTFPSKSGTITPGIRFENQEGKTTVGFAVLYAP